MEMYPSIPTCCILLRDSHYSFIIVLMPPSPLFCCFLISNERNAIILWIPQDFFFLLGKIKTFKNLKQIKYKKSVFVWFIVMYNNQTRLRFLPQWVANSPNILLIKIGQVEFSFCYTAWEMLAGLVQMWPFLLFCQKFEIIYLYIHFPIFF